MLRGGSGLWKRGIQSVVGWVSLILLSMTQPVQAQPSTPVHQIESASRAPFTAQSAAVAPGSLLDFEKLFRPFATGWTGADGLYAIPLQETLRAEEILEGVPQATSQAMRPPDPNPRVLWLFGDTLIGRINPKERQILGMLRNSAALQNTDGVHFTPPLLPALDHDFIPSPTADQWFWPGPGLFQQGELFLALPAFVHVPTHEEAFGFRQAQTVWVSVKQAHQPPAQWQFTYRPVPWSAAEAQNVSYTVAGVQDTHYWYLYGYGDHDVKPPTTFSAPTVSTDVPRRERRAFLLRLPRLPHPFAHAPEFWDGRDWSPEVSAAQPLFSGFQSEASVAYDSSLKRYVMVYTANDFSGQIKARLAPRPEGPWSEPHHVYTPPEHGQGQAFCYAGKHYPHLQGRLSPALQKKGLVLGYACNSFQAQDLSTHPELYLPRFVDVPWPAGWSKQ